MRKRERRLQRYILDTLERAEFPDGYDIEVKRVSDYIVEKKPSLHVRNLIQLVISCYRKRLFITIHRPEFQIYNLRCRLRNLAFKLDDKVDDGVHMFFGFDAGIVMKKADVYEYPFQIFDSPMHIEFRDVVVVKNNHVILKNGTSIYLNTKRASWK